MSALRRRYCIFGCDGLSIVHGVPLHRFPKPDKRPEVFAAWIAAVGRIHGESDTNKIYKNKRICDHHFDPTDKTTGGRLIWSAIPKTNLKCVQQSIITFVETDHSYCRPRRESGLTGPMVEVANISESSAYPEHLLGPCRSGPLSAEFDSTEVVVPSASTSTTCFTTSEKEHVQTSQIKLNADKTIEHVEKKTEKQSAKKQRLLKNEIIRLRNKVKTIKFRLQKVLKDNKRKNFETFTKNMSEPAKLFTRMQYMEGQKKNKGRRFSIEEKILALSIFKESPKAYKFMYKHFTLPSQKLLKSSLAKVKLFPGYKIE